MAVALKEAAQPSFSSYIQQVQTNTRALASNLQSRNYTIVTDGTDNHIVLWDARSTGLSGAMIEKALEWCDISANKNAIFGDTSALNPGGVRLGTLAMTTRGMNVTDMVWIGDMIHRVVQLAHRIHTHYQLNINADNAAAVSIIKRHPFVTDALGDQFWPSFMNLREEVRRYMRFFAVKSRFNAPP